MASSIHLASEEFEQKKSGYEQKVKENLQQIKKLEVDNEKLVIDAEQKIAEIEKLKTQVALLSAESKNHEHTLQELKSEHKQLQKENLDLNKALSSMEGQIIEKDKLIMHYEKK